HTLTMDELKAELDSLHAEQQTFFEALIATSTMEQFRALQQQARKISKRFQALMQQFNEEERETVEALRVELKQKQSVMEKFTAEKQELEAAQQRTQIAIATAENKQQH